MKVGSAIAQGLGFRAGPQPILLSSIHLARVAELLSIPQGMYGGFRVYGLGFGSRIMEVYRLAEYM